MPYREFRERMRHFDVRASELHSPSSKVDMYRAYDMGVGTDATYPIPYSGEDFLMAEPEVAAVLEKFEISAYDFMAVSV